MGRMDDFGLSMPVRLAEDCERPVRIVNALDLICDDLGGFIPANLDVLRFPSVLWISLSVRIPVDALHRMQNAILRIDSLLVADGQRWNHRLFARLEYLPARFNLPRLALFDTRNIIVMQRANAQDLVVLHINA